MGRTMFEFGHRSNRFRVNCWIGGVKEWLLVNHRKNDVWVWAPFKQVSCEMLDRLGERMAISESREERCVSLGTVQTGFVWNFGYSGWKNGLYFAFSSNRKILVMLISQWRIRYRTFRKLSNIATTAAINIGPAPINLAIAALPYCSITALRRKSTKGQNKSD